MEQRRQTEKERERKRAGNVKKMDREKEAKRGKEGSCFFFLISGDVKCVNQIERKNIAEMREGKIQPK